MKHFVAWGVQFYDSHSAMTFIRSSHRHLAGLLLALMLLACVLGGTAVVLLEANHEREMLLMGRYPYPLKQRILGDEGHLSNVSAGECLGRIASEREKKRQVLLGHLSRENNDPSVAMLAVKNTLEEQEIYIGGDLQVQVARRDERSRLYVVE